MGNNCTLKNQRVFEGGQIYIELTNDKTHYQTGEKIQGVIHVN